MDMNNEHNEYNERDLLALTLESEAQELDGESPLVSLQQKEEQEQQEKADNAAQELAVPLTLAISGAAAVLAPNWNITTDEAGQLAGVYSELLIKYFPSAANFNGGVEMNAAMVTLGIIGARVISGTPRKAEDAAAEENASGESGEIKQTLKEV